MQSVEVEIKARVKVEFPDDYTPEEILFTIEENGCPGTGRVGTALERAIEDSWTTMTCWACAGRNCSNTVISINGNPVEEKEPSILLLLTNDRLN